MKEKQTLSKYSWIHTRRMVFEMKIKKKNDSNIICNIYGDRK